MDRQNAKEELKTKEPTFLQPARTKSGGHTTYICPNCGNGSGESGDGIALNPHNKKTKRYKCFVCGLNEDVIGLWKIDKGINDNKKAFADLYQYYGLNIENDSTRHKKNNYVSYFQKCMDGINAIDYPAERGISKEIATKFMLGYDPKFTRGTNGESWQALIIPTGNNSFVARNLDAHAPKNKRYRKIGSSNLYHTRALNEARKPIFIVEGEIDALVIMSVGGEALALGSTANSMKLIRLLEKNGAPAQPLIIALDNDADGKKTADNLAKELSKLKIPFYRLNPYGKFKDAGEAIVRDPENFGNAIKNIKMQMKSEFELQKEKYLHTAVAGYLQDFVNGIASSVNTPYISTGFKALDNVLDGGLYEGIYIVGAISSLGKTTLVTQIADQIAQSGQDVLIFSLEMARAELMAKSISRHTLTQILGSNGDIRNAKTTRGITTGKRYENYSQTEKEIINRAVFSYSEYAHHLYISEGIGDIGANQIREALQQHISFTGNAPVVIVDYLQILAPYSERFTDKQNIDKAVLELKRISRDYKMPVIAISSFNRANYKEAVTMEAFKESGAIEYSSDVLIGLQLKGAGQKDFDAIAAKKKSPREIELVVLKNRNGRAGDKLSYKYYPLFNYFEEPV